MANFRLNRMWAMARKEAIQLRRDLHQPVLEVLTDDPARAVEALRDTPGVIEAALYGRAVHVMVTDEAAGLADVPRRLAAAGRAVAAVHAIAPSLEDAFVALVRRQGGVPGE